jgi:NADP-dependent 3-hydroxy acid dehydrogenase YdfG
MDFGLRGRTAIVCAASMALGKASAAALGTEGVKLVIVARRREILERAADEARACCRLQLCDRSQRLALSVIRMIFRNRVANSSNS